MGHEKAQEDCFCPYLRLFVRFFNADERTDKVDRLFAEWDRPDSPGCSLAVVRDGKILYKRGYGMANLELGIPITPQSVFYVGSVSKQFTAFCIALLAREGKLALDDDIRQHIPETPDYGNPVTIRHLLHHTSGIRDYLELENIAGIDAGSYHEQDVLELLARQKSLNFAPGEEYLYSNGGYFLLGIIVKRASGRSLRFEKQAEGRPPLMHVTIEGRNPEVYEGFQPVEPTGEKLREYEGNYYSDELEVTFRLALKEGKLHFAHKNAPAGALQPTLEDKFVLGNWHVSFRRDGENKIAGFTLDAGRVRNLKFSKL